MPNYNHIISRAITTPLLLAPGPAATMFAALAGRLGYGMVIDAYGAAVTPVAGPWDDDEPDDDRPETGYRVFDGVAVVPVTGKLVHKSGYIGARCGMMGYDGIAAAVAAADADPTVRALLLDFDSPGGEVAGVIAASDAIAAAQKPIWAHANECAASAAYWLASSCDKLFLSQTAIVGSIGVCSAHLDVSKELEMAGRKMTIIYSGAHKVDGNPYEALPADVQARMQFEMDGLRDIFAQHVASARKLTVDAIMNTEADVYRGQAAVDVGLADGVRSFNDTLAALAQKSKPSPATGFVKSGGISMTHDTPAPAAEAVDAAAQAVVAERARISAILSSPEAIGRGDLARELALNSDMTAEAATALMGKTPVIPTAAVAQNQAVATLQQMAAVTAVAPDAVASANGSEKTTLAQRVAALRGGK